LWFNQEEIKFKNYFMKNPNLSTNPLETELQAAQIQIGEQLKAFSPDQRLLILDNLLQEVKKDLEIDYERFYTGVEEIATFIEATIDKKLYEEQRGNYESQPKVLTIDDLSGVVPELATKLSQAKLLIWGNKLLPKESDVRFFGTFRSEFELYRVVNTPFGEDSSVQGKCIAIDSKGQALVLYRDNGGYNIRLVNKGDLEEGNRRHFEQYANIMKETGKELTASNWLEYNASLPDYSNSALTQHYQSIE
jgi:hypothetical protein